jgi:hypothetical protein
MSFVCRLCSREFETIPAGAIPIGRAHGFRHQFQMFQFPDRTVHDLKVVNPPKPATDLLKATVQTLLELPTPILEQEEPEQRASEIKTTMAYAFRNFKS